MLSNIVRIRRSLGRCDYSRGFFDITGTLKDGVIVGAYAEVKHSFPQEVSHSTIEVRTKSISVEGVSLTA